MKIILPTVAAATITLAACVETPTASVMTVWNYDCGNELTMTWAFETGEKGTYSLNSGSILTPENDDPNSRVFMRQDGQEFSVTGDAAKWTLKNLSSNNDTVCNRTVY